MANSLEERSGTDTVEIFSSHICMSHIMHRTPEQDIHLHTVQ